MGKRSQIEMLPNNVRKELESRIRRSCFSEYQKHSDWLAKLGCSISKSAVHRHGTKLQKRLQDIEKTLGLNAMEQMLLQDFRSLQDDKKIIQALKTISMLASGFNVSIKYEQ